MEAVDLKWSLWTADRGIWDEYAPGAWSEMRKAFFGKSDEVTVHTAPRKEIRYGTVEVREGEAFVSFRAIWDAPNCHVPEHVPEDQIDEASETIASWFDDNEGYEDGDTESPVAAQVIRKVKADSFPKLMRKIDECEEQLLREEQEASEHFAEYIAMMFPKTEVTK